MIRHRPLLAAVLALASAACTAPAPQDADAPFDEVADVQVLMNTILEPAADHYWDAVGTILDEKEGEIEIRPETLEEWEEVKNAAYVIAESGNLLMMKGRAIDDPAWMPMARALVDVGRVAIDAANSFDEAQVFDAGAEVYYVCSNCHAVFAIETLAPNDERSN